QAEDGIRDRNVTGVQTCALPIWLVRLLKRVEKLSFDFADHVITINEPIEDLLVERGLPRSKSTVIMNTAEERRFASASRSSATRSEERRVGKEGRSRWGRGCDKR